MDQPVKIKVVWNSRIDGMCSALAEEAKAGYAIGDIVAVILPLKAPMPTEMYVLPKHEHHDTI
ncbi:hypothetical protein C8N47_111109 [Mangrovibacterium marinum]|uniref:Uncharacterized protein n=1 Tax=Mangrovibacterium marinum TaxID=1639118 RepID=A0A2T5C0F0_9BACT|nr:hypothetical protein [Mangrovibacterium marinum]PTN08069.1 hypothetical protein C8N47_111109 [Mangrovibacterium marinum]